MCGVDSQPCTGLVLGQVMEVMSGQTDTDL